jgi:hypothetical protein
MKFWIDRSSESDNVIIATDAAILVGSCDEAAYDSVEQQLTSQRNPIEVLGTGDLTTIPYNQIQRLTSRSTDKDVDVGYKVKKEVEQEHLFFEDLERKGQFVAELDRKLPACLIKNEFAQSVVGATFSPMISLLLSLASGYLFINKFRWLTIIVAGLWAASSLFLIISRASAPPTVTRWTIDGRYARKLWTGVKTLGAYAFLALIVVVITDESTDAWGTKSIYEQLAAEKLTPESVTTFLERGADINYRDENGDTPLAIAMDWGENDIAVALIDAGADLTSKGSHDLNPTEYAVYNDLDLKILQALTRNGASLDFKIDGMTPLEYARENELAELEVFLMDRDQIQSSAQ